MVRIVPHAAAAAAYTPPPPYCSTSSRLPLSTKDLHALQGKSVTLVGFGSLLSEISSRTTFPELTNFRLGRVQGFRRVFRHPAAIFFTREIAIRETKEFSSLSVEPVPDDPSVGFVCSLFDIEDFDVHAYLAREEEFAFTMASYKELDRRQGKEAEEGEGLMCLATNDANVEERWGKGYIARTYGVHGLESIWDAWGPNSGILPCPIYLRHCLLAAMRHEEGGPAHTSFLKETYLADRTSTIEEYLRKRPEIMSMQPPVNVLGRYSG